MSVDWYALHVKSKCENRVYGDLCARGLEAFLPLRRAKHYWSDRAKWIDVPIFPGYLFTRFDLADRFPILNSQGVAQIVGAGSTPIPIPDSEIAAVRAMIDSKIDLLPWPYLKTGQTVRIDHGPLAGLEGIVVRTPECNPRIVVSVNLLQRSIAAEIERDWIGNVR